MSCFLLELPRGSRVPPQKLPGKERLPQSCASPSVCSLSPGTLAARAAGSSAPAERCQSLKFLVDPVTTTTPQKRKALIRLLREPLSLLSGLVCVLVLCAPSRWPLRRDRWPGWPLQRDGWPDEQLLVADARRGSPGCACTASPWPDFVTLVFKVRTPSLQ